MKKLFNIECYALLLGWTKIYRIGSVLITTIELKSLYLKFKYQVYERFI